MAEGAPLLRAYRVTPIEGSNPSLSAIQSASLPNSGDGTRSNRKNRAIPRGLGRSGRRDPNQRPRLRVRKRAAALNYLRSQVGRLEGWWEPNRQSASSTCSATVSASLEPQGPKRVATRNNTRFLRVVGDQLERNRTRDEGRGSKGTATRIYLRTRCGRFCSVVGLESSCRCLESELLGDSRCVPEVERADREPTEVSRDSAMFFGETLSGLAAETVGRRI